MQLTRKALAYARTHAPIDRQAIADEIERLIALLDAIDPDPDLEPNGDEDDSSFPEGWRTIAAVDGANTLPEEDWEDDGTGEPILGWGLTADWESQAAIALERDRDEREIDHDFEEVNEDGGDILDGSHDQRGNFSISGGGSGPL